MLALTVKPCLSVYLTVPPEEVDQPLKVYPVLVNVLVASVIVAPLAAL